MMKLGGIARLVVLLVILVLLLFGLVYLRDLLSGGSGGSGGPAPTSPGGRSGSGGYDGGVGGKQPGLIDNGLPNCPSPLEVDGIVAEYNASRELFLNLLENESTTPFGDASEAAARVRSDYAEANDAYIRIANNYCPKSDGSKEMYDAAKRCTDLFYSDIYPETFLGEQFRSRYLKRETFEGYGGNQSEITSAVYNYGGYGSPSGLKTMISVQRAAIPSWQIAEEHGFASVDLGGATDLRIEVYYTDDFVSEEERYYKGIWFQWVNYLIFAGYVWEDEALDGPKSSFEAVQLTGEDAKNIYLEMCWTPLAKAQA